MGRKRIRPPRKPADPAHISAVRRAAALASAKVRAARAAHNKCHPKTKAVHIRAELFARVAEEAQKRARTISDITSEAVESGLPHLH